MKRMLVLALVVIICGCNSVTQRLKNVPDSSEVAEVPEEVWQRFQKKIEEQAKANALKKEQQPASNQEQERMPTHGIGRAPGTPDKRR